jgi:hypothetical protein
MKERVFYSEYFYQRGSKDTDVIERTAREHPYSSLAAFLLLYHYKKTGHPGFEKLAKKTALLFNNTNWLQFQLHENSFAHTGQEIINDENLSAKKEIPFEEKIELTPEITSMQNFREKPVEVQEETKLPIQSDKIVHESIDEIDHKSVDETSHEPNVIGVETITETTEHIDKTLTAENRVTETAIKEISEEIPVDNSPRKDDFTTNEDDDEVPAFEPFHTVDYFASQGIQITEELINNDKLGSQMKSFTAWLKGMKKLHPGKLEEQSLATEKLIQTSADASNINTEVLTEAMAEVLIKQDKKEKAIEMFSKLSLINPSKSAYFAARIESIKSN